MAFDGFNGVVNHLPRVLDVRSTRADLLTEIPRQVSIAARQERVLDATCSPLPIVYDLWRNACQRRKLPPVAVLADLYHEWAVIRAPCIIGTVRTWLQVKGNPLGMNIRRHSCVRVYVGFEHLVNGIRHSSFAKR